MTRAKRMHRRLIEVLTKMERIHLLDDYVLRIPVCWGFDCLETKGLEIDHPNGRRVSNRDPRHRRKSFAARVKEYWLAFAAGESLQVLCRSCNVRDGGGRRIGR